MLVVERQKQIGLLEVSILCHFGFGEPVQEKVELSQVKNLNINIFPLEFKRRLVLDSCLQYKFIQGGPDALVV